MIYTISGDIGSGKSTTGKLLAETLGFEYLSTGSIQRQLAKEMGMTTLELNVASEKLTEIDDKIDGYTAALSDSDENYVVDSRLAWHFIPKSYKIFLKCREEVAAQRISLDKQRVSDEENRSIENLLSKIKARRASEKRRFKEKYEIDFEDLSNYDFIVDTEYFLPEELIPMIIKGSEEFNTNKR